MFKMTDKTYDILKFIAQIFLPALGTLYFALAGIWGLPYAEQIVGTITAIDTFLGLLLGIQAKSYNNSDQVGKLLIDKSDPEQIIYKVDIAQNKAKELTYGDKFLVTVNDKVNLQEEFKAFMDSGM